MGEREQGKLYVGGLSWNTTTENLESTFSEYGEIIDCKVITDRETGRSRGFGFVTFSNDSDAANAKKCMHETELDGRQVKPNCRHYACYRVHLNWCLESCCTQCILRW
ncbi:hypothetical protein Bbelb_113260 [Branchiostoma belcheri]|nr:hypothetical protein Bbelb_113260 [Branchiostoma belcheri]